MRGAAMGLIRLEDDQKVNVHEIDAQHETLIDLINQLHAAMTQRSERAVLDQLMAALIEHTRTHFDYEEQLMLEHRYPGYTTHKHEHDRLIQHILALAEQYRRGDLLLSFAVMVDLKGWALVHIERFDIALGVFLNRPDRLAGIGDSTSKSGTR
jgi:hemerythrin-like metal-binding protein